MRFEIYVFVLQWIVFNNRYYSAIGKPMVGENVRRATEREFPSVVSIKYINNNTQEPETDHDCTGILVSRQDVLSAAHCFDNYELTTIEIIVGSNDLRSGHKHYPLWWINYNQWAKQRRIRRQFSDNDIGVMRLTEKVSEQITPVVLSPISTSNLYGSNVVVAGWGKTDTGKIPRFMETVNLKVLSKEECESRIERLHGSKIVMDERYLCTVGDPLALLHEGDSGGPLLRLGRLVGINKSTCPLPDIEIHPQKVNIHFSVFFYTKFIEDVIINYK